MATRNYAAPNSLLMGIPLFGIGLYLFLFLLATYLYPGGSQADKQADGFSWMHNYWCNLLNVYAINGRPNVAKPVALSALLILCISLSMFWYYLPLLFSFRSRGSRLIRWSGISSMVSAVFIATDFHDAVINIAGVLGLIALTGTFIGLYRARLVRLLWLGMGCLLLMALNNYIYYTKDFLYYLPVVQKITFAIVLLWISLLTLRVRAQQSLPAR